MREKNNRMITICVVLCTILILTIASGTAEKMRGHDQGLPVSSKKSSTDIPEQMALEKEEREKYYYGTLKDEEKQVYREILEGIRNNEEVIRVEMAEAKRVNQIYEFVLNDFPDIFWCNGAAKTTAFQAWGEGYSEFCPEYTYEGETKEKMQSDVEQAKEDFLKQAKEVMSGPEFDKIQFVYEYVIRTVDYVSGAKDSQNLYSALVNKQSVCAGYAKEVQFLLEQIGIFSTYVTGETQGQPHAWNLVRCNGKYYYVDATWGDPVFSESEKEEIPEEQQIQYDYLCCSEEELFRTHQLDPDLELPSCTAMQDQYYVREGCFYQRYDEERMKKQLRDHISSGEPVTVFKFSGQKAYEESREKLINEVIPDSASDLAAWYQLDQVTYRYQDDSVLFKITVYWKYRSRDG